MSPSQAMDRGYSPLFLCTLQLRSSLDLAGQSSQRISLTSMRSHSHRYTLRQIGHSCSWMRTLPSSSILLISSQPSALSSILFIVKNGTTQLQAALPGARDSGPVPSFAPPLVSVLFDRSFFPWGSSERMRLAQNSHGGCLAGSFPRGVVVVSSAALMSGERNDSLPTEWALYNS